MAIIKKFRIKSFKNINTIIEFKNVSLAYGNRLILDNISFGINEGQIFGMLGPNGVGKSTIFNLITGLITPKYGKIFINGQDATNFPIYLRTKKFKVGYVPQYGGFFNDLTLNDNLKAISEIVIKDQEIIVNLQQENRISICICDHQARDLLACVDVAMILSNCKIIAQDTPSNLVKNINAQNAYFGDSFKIN